MGRGFKSCKVILVTVWEISFRTEKWWVCRRDSSLPVKTAEWFLKHDFHLYYTPSKGFAISFCYLPMLLCSITHQFYKGFSFYQKNRILIIFPDTLLLSIRITYMGNSQDKIAKSFLTNFSCKVWNSIQRATNIKANVIYVFMQEKKQTKNHSQLISQIAGFLVIWACVKWWWLHPSGKFWT